ncbi:MAG: hypothetical protein CBC34_006935 [Hyphomicrobiaceae bacterium TMED74]|nr:MAG: hypothetical protein CBC34_006935 [Hyphomicrobiaceae bacterium TMED74]
MHHHERVLVVVGGIGRVLPAADSGEVRGVLVGAAVDERLGSHEHQAALGEQLVDAHDVELAGMPHRRAEAGVLAAPHDARHREEAVDVDQGRPAGAADAPNDRPACDREDVPGGENCTEEQVHDPVEEV